MKVTIETALGNARNTTVIETNDADEMAFLLDVLGKSVDTDDTPITPPIQSDGGETVH